MLENKGYEVIDLNFGFEDNEQTKITSWGNLAGRLIMNCQLN